jgi:1-acyl-sn-glycerol-3-phosphate acyltransferase
MLYGLLKVIMTIALRLFYRRVYVTGLENIADKGPAIIMPNHNSSLMDAALLGILIKRPLYFFARGDVFVNAFVERLLARFHMLPVHPHDGGRKTLGDNNAAFSRAEKILLDGGIIIFFPEGVSHTDKQLKPLRKGVFRLAFNTAAKRNFEMNIPLIPAGVTYSNPFCWRSEVMVHLGAPMQLADYVESFKSNASATLLQLSKVAYLDMEQQVPNIKNAEWNALTNNAVEIVMNDFDYQTSSWRQATRNRLDKEKGVYGRISLLDERSRRQLETSVDKYRQLLGQYGLEDASLSKKFSFQFIDLLLLILSLLFFPAGYLLNAVPVFIAKRIAVTKVTRDDFFSWILVTTATVTYLLWYLLIVVIGLCIWWPAGLALMLCMPLLGLVSLYCLKKFRDFNQYKKLRALPEATREVIIKHRQEILEVFSTTFHS